MVTVLGSDSVRVPVPSAETWRVTAVSLRGDGGLIFRIEIAQTASQTLLQSPEFDLAINIVAAGGTKLVGHLSCP